MKKVHFPIIAALLLFAACKKLGICHDAEFSIEKTPYTGSQLRTDGYYYGEPDTDYAGVVRRDVLILYRNGIVAFPGSKQQDSMDQHAAEPMMTDLISGWGMYIVEGNTIKTERWQSTYGPCKPIILTNATILNDTTMVLTTYESRTKRGKPETGAYNERYNFRQMANKPTGDGAAVDTDGFRDL